MNDRVDVRSKFVYQQVHRDLARRLAIPAKPFALHIHNNAVFGFNEALVGHRGRAQHVAVGKPNAEVSVRGREIPLVVRQSRKVGDILSQLIFRGP